MSKSAHVPITDAEWEVMESVWRQDDQTAGEILEHVPAGNRSHRTLRTLLARLVQKGAVSVRVERSRHLYRAALSREVCVRSAARSFTERFFAGNLRSLLLHFVEHESLTDEEAEELRSRLAAYTSASKGRSGKKKKT